MLEPWVRQVMMDTLDPWRSQEPALSVREMVDYIETEQEEGDLLFVGSKKANLVIMARYVTPWVAEIHVFGKNKDGFALVRATKKAFQHLFANVGFHKLEAKLHDPKEVVLAKRSGMTLEGTHPEAIKLEDGTFTEEYSYGIIKEQSI